MLGNMIADNRIHKYIENRFCLSLSSLRDVYE